MALVLSDPACRGIILSTRPDMLSREVLAGIARRVQDLSKDCLIELGLQSIHSRSLRLLNRGHGYSDFLRAYHRIREYSGIEVGAHLILGIPGESEEMMLASIQQVCALGVEALKLHHLQVVRGTRLEHIYRREDLSLFTRNGYLNFLLKALPRIPREVVIHRLWATTHPQFLVAPRWDVLAADLSKELARKMGEQSLWQGKFAVARG
jgi:radical SAM protein (TIGR01212 family)